VCIAFILNASFVFASDSAEEKIDNEKIYFVPVLMYEHAAVAERKYHAPGAIAVIAKGNRELPFENDSESFFFGAIYKQYIFSDIEVPNYSNNYHDIEMMIEKRYGRHYLVALFESYAQRPIAGGLQSFATGAGYAYDFISRSNFSFIFGFGIGVSDFGIDMPNGRPLPVLLIPVTRISGNFSWLKFTFEFINKPMLNFTILPKKKVRFTGYFRMDRYNDAEDIIFDCALWYRFFSEKHIFGDFAGIAVGMKNEGKNFSLPDEDRYYLFRNYSVYGKLDFSFLQLSCGYIFKASETFEYGNDKTKIDTGKGAWGSVVAAYKF